MKLNPLSLFFFFLIREPRPLESAIRAISERRLNGDVGPTAHARYAMRVVYVREQPTRLHRSAVCSLALSISLSISDYAKLVRKRDKNLGPDGRPVVIDLEMLRASTRAANEKEKEKLEQQRRANGDPASSQHQQQQQQNEPMKTQGTEPALHASSPSLSAMKAQILQSPQMQPQYHVQTTTTGAGYQYPAIAGAQEGAGASAGMPPPAGANVMAGAVAGAPLATQGHSEHGGPGAAQSWVTSAARMYGHEQGQSFMRTSHSGR